MKKSKRKTNKNTAIGIYRSPNLPPKMKNFESLADIQTLLGNVPLSLTAVDGNMHIISRTDAKKEGEPRNMYYTLSNGEVSYTRDFHGDVVIIGYEPDKKQIVGLSKEQIKRIMCAPRK